MVDIEPFTYQKSTNIDEHNQIVNKLNEVVDVINDTNLETITPEIDALKTATTKNTTDISQLKISDAEHTKQIATIDSNVDAHAREISALKTAVGDCFNDVALGSDGKSLDFTATDGQVNNIALPSGSNWVMLSSPDISAYYSSGRFTKNLYVMMWEYQTDGETVFQVNEMYTFFIPKNIDIVQGGNFIMSNGDATLLASPTPLTIMNAYLGSSDCTYYTSGSAGSGIYARFRIYISD